MRLEFDEAVTMILRCDDAITDAERDRDAATSEEFRRGAEKRIRVHRHTIASVFSYFDGDDRTRLMAATRRELTQTEQLF